MKTISTVLLFTIFLSGAYLFGRHVEVNELKQRIDSLTALNKSLKLQLDTLKPKIVKLIPASTLKKR